MPASDWKRISGTSRNNPQYQNQQTGEVRGKSYVDNLKAVEAGFKSRHEAMKVRQSPEFQRYAREVAKGDAKKERSLKNFGSSALADFKALFHSGKKEPGALTKEQGKLAQQLIADGKLHRDPALLQRLREQLGSPGRRGR